MAELEGSQTEANLRTALAMESEASRRYAYFAQQADVDGHPEVAALFRSVADGETGHAFGHLDFLIDCADPVGGAPLGSTEENLAAAEAGERRESQELYPAFAEVARREGFGEIADWLESLAGAEGHYAERFAKARDDLNGGSGA